MNVANLSGRRILVVEDDLMIAMLIDDVLKEAGCDVVGPLPRLAPALQAASSERLDGALLDINLAGELVSPVADRLIERGVPFLFLTGYGWHMLPERFHTRPLVTKPCRQDILLSALARAVAAH
ncbi:MAG TPA: response regulator [Alphaproteobacteria bacterium]|nr:response regulator [Alphaproteobacteria bacterium]